MSVQSLLRGLNKEQEKAVVLEANAVVAAGAGSGKTKVLASRYVWLILQKKLKPEEILTLTFTNKAVSEMYSRIYQYLLENNADDAIRDFHKARISTLDSFSASIARTAAPRYGISPDFKSDDAALRDLAREAALQFVLDNREAPAIQQLLPDHKIRRLAEEIFTQIMIRHSPISSPLDLDKYLLIQRGEIIRAWKEKSQTVQTITANMIDELHHLMAINKSINFTKALEKILLNNPVPPLPEIDSLLEIKSSFDNNWDESSPLFETRQKIKIFFEYYSAIIAISASGNIGAVYAPLVDNFKLLKGKNESGLFYELESIANYILNFYLCSGLFELINKFQYEINAKKRETGFLSFNDIAHLAVDALKDHPDIRKVYKDSLKMIMIDEFQDNNALQRDLVYLLAENTQRMEKGIPAPTELETNRMFFVGDEKQSIYRFRGADVTVFRSLGTDLLHKQGNGSIELEFLGLTYNYRSRPSLISLFNRIFGGYDNEQGFSVPGVFLSSSSKKPETLKGIPDFEAQYSDMLPPDNESSKEKPLAHFCFLKSDDLDPDDEGGIKSHDLEAVFIAKKIRDMVDKKEKIHIRTNDGIELRACNWSDFAVLQRAYTHQNTLEKYFREFGVPYNTDRPSGLFNDAPILDMRAYLRLLVYPEDRIAYAALIRSPFMRLSDLTLAACLLGMNTPGKKNEPFAEENEPLIPENDLFLYRQARTKYTALREASASLSITELVTRLWFDEGYRYETLWTESAQVYESLFDLFFSLASDYDAKGKNLTEFIEYLDDIMNREERPDDKDIPGEGDPGVRIMSIHKSKGLEFPCVFLFDCSSAQNSRRFVNLLGFHTQYGPVIKLPQAEELPIGGNYFQKIIEEEEKAKDTAELRRLLYVAMTRAESRLFLSFTLPKQTKEEKKNWDLQTQDFTSETISRRLAQLNEKPEGRDTFLKLIQGTLPECPSSLCTLEPIPVLSRAEIAKIASDINLAARSGPHQGSTEKSQQEAAIAAADYYEKAETLPEGKAANSALEASKLRYKVWEVGSGEWGVGESQKTPSDISDTISGLSPADFGSMVHAVLEARLKEEPLIIPHKIKSLVDNEKTLESVLSAAQAMADSFINSDLGKRWAVSINRESEYPVITSVIVEGKPIAITGQMDLLFEEENEVTVVDFKTDRTENPEDHYGQLAAYRQAAGDIFGKPASAWLFYLRSGRAVNVTDEVKALSLEEIATTTLAATTLNNSPK
ncbi:MAG: UvrD-helicase domain-containing protein [Treponema sp.]|nr:UvrD-helicase domain-containing protein [Treponema sp.]